MKSGASSSKAVAAHHRHTRCRGGRFTFWCRWTGRRTTATVVELVLGSLVLFAVIVWQIRQIVQSEHPGIRAVEALAFSVPLYILLFATTYYLMDHANAATFTQPLTRIDSMYFSATVFTTVGFGDITAKGQGARVLVTIQMMLDLVVIGLVVRLVVNAVKVGRQRQS